MKCASLISMLSRTFEKMPRNIVATASRLSRKRFQHNGPAPHCSVVPAGVLIHVPPGMDQPEAPRILLIIEALKNSIRRWG